MFKSMTVPGLPSARFSHARLFDSRGREECELSEIVFEPLMEMARQVRAKKISPVELVRAHLARIAKLNPKLNAFVQVDAERARKQARVAEAALTSRGGADLLGALHGVPVSIKSSIDVEGLGCECGSRLRKGMVAPSDAPLVARLRAAGAIILGNTNVPEFLMAYETDNLLHGRTNDPSILRAPRGSSGGEAAAIAAGCSAGGVGSDSSGSMRVPAHYSGICGLKPTPGRIPSTGHFPGSAGPFAILVWWVRWRAQCAMWNASLKSWPVPTRATQPLHPCLCGE